MDSTEPPPKVFTTTATNNHDTTTNITTTSTENNSSSDTTETLPSDISTNVAMSSSVDKKREDTKKNEQEDINTERNAVDTSTILSPRRTDGECDDENEEDDYDDSYHGEDEMAHTTVTTHAPETSNVPRPALPDTTSTLNTDSASTGTTPSGKHTTTTTATPITLPPPPMLVSSQHSSSNSTVMTETAITTTAANTMTPAFGSMQSVVLLLRNYKEYGLADRVVYHFNALQAPTTTTTSSSSSSSSQLQQLNDHPNDDSVSSRPRPIAFTTSTGSTSNYSITHSNSNSMILQTNPSSSSLLSIPETMVATSSAVRSTDEGDATVAATDDAVVPPITTHQPPATKPSYGVVRILESIPTRPWHKFTRRQKKDFKLSLRQFNDHPRHDHPNTSTSHVPISPLPFQMYSQTRLYTTYEITNIAYIIDASSTLTCCSDMNHETSFLCPMDRLIRMSKTFFTALMEPIVTSTGTIYQPQLAITVLAVYPTTSMDYGTNNNNNNNSSNDRRQYSNKCASVLVRDFHMTDRTSTEILCRQVEEFCYTEVESEIAARMRTRSTTDMSQMSQMLDAGYVALSSLSDQGRPLIVVGTDGCGVQCSDASISDPQQQNQPVFDDIPIIVLDCSSPTVHTPQINTSRRSTSAVDDNSRNDVYSWMRDDREDATYSLHQSDDSDRIHKLCQVTGGAFWNDELLQLGATTRAEQVDSNSIFHLDYYFAFRKHTSFRKHSIQSNAVQWYTLFQLSQLSPRVHDDWGHLPPPRYLSQQPPQYTRHTSPSRDGSSSAQSLHTAMQRQNSYQNDTIRIQQLPTHSNHSSSQQHSCITFSNYIVNPIPIHEILLMRIKEGYRAKQYGQSNMLDSDRISILFTLSLQMGVTIRYELSFIVKSHPSMTGSAHIKIELAGDTDLVLSIKKQYLNSPPTPTMQQKICTYVRSIQKEDLLQAYISPVHWTDQLSAETTPFISRLGTLSSYQHKIHFVRNEFDCVCVGHMPWDDDDFLSEFRDNDDGSQHLIDAVQAWSTQTIIEGKSYIKQTHPECGVGGYAITSIVQSPVAPRLYTVTLETFSGVNTQSRHNLLISIQNVVDSLHSVEVLPKQLCKSLIVTHSRWRYGPDQYFSQCVTESLQNHASWDLVKDPELTSLLMKRRKEIGKFNLLEFCETHGSFARIYDNETLSDGRQDPGNLSQYHFAVLDDKLVVDFYMEFESGIFSPFREGRLHQNRLTAFRRLVMSLKKRDQECGHALRCRTLLLQAFDVPATTVVSESHSELYRASVLKLLAYSSKVSTSLRFFHCGIGEANNILHNLTKESLLLQSYGPKVAELPISPEIPLTDSLEVGNWFIVEYDKYTSSIVHFSSKDTSVALVGTESSSTCRELIFYTFGISDLYNRRDDADDDAIDDDHISEHLQVSEFCDSIQLVHEQNYSYAAYLSLSSSGMVDPEVENSKLDFSTEDVGEVMKPIDFVKVGQVTISLDAPIDHGVTFLKMFDSILYRFPRDNCCFYLNDNGLDYEFSPIVNENADLISKNSNLDDADDEDQQSISSNKPDQRDGQPLNEIEDAMSEFDAAQCFLTSAPKFVRFLLNDAPLSADNVDQIKKDSTLSVLISIFKEKSSQTTILDDADLSRLPSSHLTSAAILSFLLHAYVAELTLNHLRLQHTNLQYDDILHAKLCMQNARNILKCTVDLFFYSQKSDTIVKASESQLSELEIELAFDLLVTELRLCQSFNLKSLDSVNGYMLEAVESDSNMLPYWCFLKMQTLEGTVIVDVYHPIGLAKATELIELIVDDITACCHRVNQILLLISLNNTRLASNLLIPDIIDNSRPETVALDRQDTAMQFQDGHFGCPVAYETSFELFHRLAANPMKVVRSLETYVLQNFAVSNRPELFVYKDEYGSIFYMKVSIQEPKAATKDMKSLGTCACIDFVVYGIGVPGSSITEQLRNLLHKHLLSIAVDMLTTVLTKNPRFHWRQLDIRFVKSFRTHANNLGESNLSASSNFKTYKFPVSAFDPGMVALFFRQNLCGSTFFHPLLSADGENSWTQNEMPSSDRNYMQLQPSELVFFYNASSSDLDPSLQSESTLTSKGSRYSAQTGSGLAIIEVSLLNRKGQPCLKTRAALSAYEESHIEPCSTQHMTFVEVTDDFCNDDESNETPIYIRINIADTALKTDVLHEWILLSMNQAIMAWNVERQLERIQNGITPLFVPGSGEIGYDKKIAMEKACPGLPILLGILEHAQKLPDPTALLEEFDGVVRSSTVAAVALELLEKIVLDQLQTATKTRLLPDKHYKLVIVRSCRSSSPQIVKLERDSSGHIVVRRTDQTKQHPPIIDSPIDCPEYTIFFHSPDYSNWMESNQIVVYPKLFKEVAVGYEKFAEKGEFTRLLFDFKQKHASLFRRSIAFVFSVKKNRRRFLGYNWNNSLFKRTTKRLADVEGTLQKSYVESAQFLNYRCLHMLSPVSAVDAPLKTVPTPTTHAPDSKDNMPSNVDRPSISRSTLPPTIRRPKLVGKSIEGSAVHAQAKSRARASATRFKGIAQSSTPIAQRKHSNTSIAVPNDSVTIDSGKKHTTTIITKPVRINGGDRPIGNGDFHLIKSEFESSLRHTASQANNRFTICQQLTKTYWPQKSSQTMSESLAAFIFSMAPISWIDVSAMLPYPQLQEAEFLHSFGNTLTASHPELSAVRVANMPGVHWLSGKLRKLKMCRAFIVLKITLSCLPDNGRSNYMVNLEGRLLTLRRRGKLFQISCATIENVSAGLDKLASDIRIITGLQGQLLDHCAFVIERTMKSLTTTSEYKDVVSILRPLIELFPLRTVIKTIRSNYKCYKATIVLTSYADPIISSYNGIDLYNWLSSNVENTNLINCGSSGLCLKKVISVNGTQSIGFLKFDEKKLENMCLYILCRTQGRDLYEFMFRDDSNIAVSLFSNIAIEAAGIAYSELRIAAFNLHRDSIWNSLVTSSSGSSDSVLELLQICTVTPLNEMFVDFDRLVSLKNDPALFDPSRLLDYITKDPTYSLTWQNNGSDGVSQQHLYYLHNDDIYLMVSTFVHGVQCRFELIERATKNDPNPRMNRIVGKIINSLLYFIWSETCNG